MNIKKIIISGGGTGGHIFPAIAIANALKKRNSEIDILFVGAKSRMEMKKIPAAGYKIIGLPVIGFQRKLSIKNISFFFKLFSSLIKSSKIIKAYKPDIVIGVGGFASGPLLRVATKRNVPALIQEQNSYAGVTNRLLADKAKKVCVAYEGMDKYFPKEKIVLTGNPVRQDLMDIGNKKREAFAYFKLNEGKKVLLIIGGSLGARSINESVLNNLEVIQNSDVQIVWQTGELYFDEAIEKTKDRKIDNLKVYDFISRMDLAYSSADLVISRAGAGTISELCLVQKPVILIPSPNVAEDHQTKNAFALVNKKAAILIKDKAAREEMITQAFGLIKKNEILHELAENISRLAIRDSAERIVDEIFKIMEN